MQQVCATLMPFLICRCSIKETPKPVQKQSLGSLKVKVLPREGACVLVVELAGCTKSIQRN